MSTRYYYVLSCGLWLLFLQPLTPAAQAQPQADSSHLAQSPRRDTRLKITTPSRDSRAKKTCHYVMTQLVTTMKHLLQISEAHYTTANDTLPHQQPWHQLLQYSSQSCHHSPSRNHILKTAARLRAKHTHKVGVLIPSQGLEPYLIEAFHHGLRSACQHLNCDPQNNLVVASYNPHATDDLNRAFADLLYHEGVSVIIGGFQAADHAVLNHMSTLFAMPLFLMSPPLDTLPLSRHVFLHSPSERHLLARLMEHFRAQNIKQVVLLEPKSARGTTQQKFTAMAQHYGVELAAYYSYDNHYRSIVKVSEEVLQLRPHHRQAEWAELVKQKTREYEQHGDKLTATDIFLEPQFNYDAIMIADNAKMVRHFAKIFRYLRLKHPIPLVGMHLWRTQELITPWDPLLEGAYFADFIGNYSNLPSFVHHFDRSSPPTNKTSSSIPTTHNGYFTDPSQMAAVDLQLLSYRAMRQAIQAIVIPNLSRHRLSTRIRLALKQQTAAHGTSLPRKPHEVHWPTYLFKVSRGGIHARPSSTAFKPIAHHLSPQNQIQQAN